MRPLFILSALVALSACAEDKQKHFAAGAATSIVITEITGSKLKGCLGALAIGAAKEVYDMNGRGNVEAADVVATGFGCAVTIPF